MKRELLVPHGCTIGDEPIGITEKLGKDVEGFHEGQRVVTGAITDLTDWDGRKAERPVSGNELMSTHCAEL